MVARAGELTDDGRSQVLRFRSDVVAEGQRATRQAAAAVATLVDRDRQAIDGLRESVLGALQHALDALGVATKDDLALERRLIADKVSTAIEQVAAESRRNNDELRESVERAVRNELSAFGGVAEAIEDLAAESRRHNDELRETVQGAMSREPNVLGLVIEAIEELAAQSRRLMTKDDLVALERRGAQLRAPRAEAGPPAAAAP